MLDTKNTKSEPRQLRVSSCSSWLVLSACPTATVRNFVNGAPSSATSDDDQIIRQVNEDRLRTKYWGDLYPADTDGTPDSEGRAILSVSKLVR